MVFDSCDADYDTILRLYHSSSADLVISNGTEIAVNDDGGCCPPDEQCANYLQSRLVVNRLPAGAYAVIQSGHQDAVGDYSLTMACSTPVSLEAPYQGQLGCGQSLNGNTETGAHRYGYNSREHYYNISVVANNTLISIDTCNSSFDTHLLIADNRSQEVARKDDGGGCSDSSATRQENYTAIFQPGDYMVVVEGYGNIQGEYTVSMSCAAPPDPNPPTQGSIECGAVITGATARQYPQVPGPDPNDNGNFDKALGRHYYNFTLNETRSVSVDTCNSDAGFDTVLELAQLNATSHLWDTVARNDDQGSSDATPCGSQQRKSWIERLLDPGSYRVTLDGYQNQTGSYQLNLACQVSTALTPSPTVAPSAAPQPSTGDASTAPMPPVMAAPSATPSAANGGDANSTTPTTSPPLSLPICSGDAGSYCSTQTPSDCATGVSPQGVRIYTLCNTSCCTANPTCRCAAVSTAGPINPAVTGRPSAAPLTPPPPTWRWSTSGSTTSGSGLAADSTGGDGGDDGGTSTTTIVVLLFLFVGAVVGVGMWKGMIPKCGGTRGTRGYSKKFANNGMYMEDLGSGLVGNEDDDQDVAWYRGDSSTYA